MQINSINNNQSFGMALKIKPDGLKRKNLTQLQAIERIGEALKDTKFYHLEIDGNGESRIISDFANEYKGIRNLSKEDKWGYWIKFDTTWDSDRGAGIKKGQPYSAAVSFLNENALNEAWSKLMGASNIEREAEMVKLLDEQAVRKYSVSSIVKTTEDKAAELMKKYGDKTQL